MNHRVSQARLDRYNTSSIEHELRLGVISFWEIRCDKDALLAHHRYHIAVSDSVNSIIFERGVGVGGCER